MNGEAIKVNPDIKFTLELKQDEVLLFMFLNSKTGRQKIEPNGGCRSPNLICS
jgi:hypothetical protein